ncbi:MAG TPA: hypothetical protein VGQ57_01620, partial [Polyangiaceae bacterium]|nr:hypothetical protein [Polyangiaceae bacterium]
LVALLLFVPWMAHAVGQTAPTARGMLCALGAFPVILLTDRAWKRWLARRRTASDPAQNALEPAT